jgi:hypothetical protein
MRDETSAHVLSMLLAAIGTDTDTSALLTRYREAKQREAYRSRRR